jgi:signal transduction histidine kinase/ActR/RegA family two-component response regulator
MGMMLLTSAAATLLTCSAMVVYELVASRRQALSQVATQARIVAANSTAALAFRDQQDAQEVLATLRTEPDIVAAALYDEKGAIFARYTAPGVSTEVPSVLQRDGYRFRIGRLEGFEPVSEHQNRRLGTLYVRSNTQALYERFWLYGVLAASVMVASLLLAYLLSRILQRRISKPLDSLTGTARAVTERGDFSVRAQPSGEAEFRVLTSAFNQMLAHIEGQNDELRDTLKEREAAERKQQDQLARLGLLHRTTRAIGERQDLDSIFNVILRSLEDNLPIDFGCICIHNAAAQRMTVTSIGPKGAPRAEQMHIRLNGELPVDENGFKRCMQGVLVHEPDTADVLFPVSQRFAAAGLRALVAAPLVVESQVFGVLLAARAKPGSFSSGDCEFLRQLSEHVALAAHQVQLYTRLHKAYDDLRDSQQAILQQERLRALGQMASGIAHDINNAISPVALYTESLLDHEPNLSERGRNFLRIIQRAIDDVGQTVARMREFYRQRERQSDLVALELNPLIEQVIELTRARWSDVPQERGIVIRVARELAADLPKVLGIESDIRDALTNLIFNAVDAMPTGGTLTLRTRTAAASNGNGERAVELEVGDTGAGMDEETRRRCFDPFFTTKGERGTGMGLAMVYGMVQRHGAHVEIDSAVGHGTTVRVQFVVATPSATRTLLSPKRPKRALNLLVVDDDPLVGQSLQHVLSNEGHSVTSVDGGQAGIDAFCAAHDQGKPFDVVMTDLGMPYVDGRAVAAAVKALSPHTPVLLLTGWGQRLSTEQNIPENVDQLLSKPPKLPDLLQALADLTVDKDPSTAHERT